MAQLLPLLLLLDFDNTVADTKSPSPNNIGLNEAHEFAIEAVFGKQGLKTYKKIGRLQNRSPLELIYDLLYEDKLLIKEAEVRNRSELFSGILWNEADVLHTTTEMFVAAKMAIYKREIKKYHGGKIWPNPCRGFLSLLKTVTDVNNNGRIKIELAILSAGHTPFIEKAFGVWGFEHPKVMLTDDHLRHLPYSVKEKTKPSVLLLSLIQKLWAKNMGKRLTFRLAEEMRSRIIYFGDDLMRDGQLAQTAGIPFGLFRESEKVFEVLKDFSSNGGGFVFGNWEIIANRILSLHSKVLEKSTAREIFLG